MGGKPVYKLMDGKGRVLVPKDMRIAAGMNFGDIVKLGVLDGRVMVRKVEIIEAGDQSPEAVEAFVRSAFKTMRDDIRISLISELSKLLQQNGEG